jgi:type I pantothenate kinase
LRELAELIAGVTARPVLVGITGPVSVGKTTIAAALSDLLRAEGLTVASVSTDGFLFSNAELEARGLMMRKGFPESFDAARLNRFLADARAGVTPLHVPQYDHLAYDVMDGEVDIEVGDVLIVEGVNTLLADHVDAYDVTVYVDAADDDVFEWFHGRLAQLFAEAADDPTSFYAPFAAWPPDQVRQFADGAWNGINQVNLEQHIRPARARARVVIEKAPDHTIRRVVMNR